MVVERPAAGIAELMAVDREALATLERRIAERLARQQPVARERERYAALLAAARELHALRRASRPKLEFPAELPVSTRREEIEAACRAHQVVVLCGETGSGKTTQLPKMLLAIGRGVDGLIGHTQPRRIAARSVAARIAQELGEELGASIGFKVRFAEQSSPRTLVQVMTDGILLAELRHDPRLLRYDALIIDEAHERSLNVDFLLGYLKELLPRRPDLKLVITSATIDPQRFADYFGGVPVIEVSGRSFEVETRYHAPDPDDDDAFDPGLAAAVLRALLEIETEPGELGRGDVLVFLPGEREIREVAEALEARAGLEVLPLYSRLSWTEQQRVFRRGSRPRVVLATNVAETSLTVPGIRSVIDSGLARISRYSARAKIQRLQVEPVARASADQRRGRCGRVGPGLCIRLYAEEDYEQRPAFAPPEVLRTNLAAVILQMEVLGLKAIDEFPFLDPPDRRQVADGYRLLAELEAVDGERRVTENGRTLARFPLDPRLARMLVEARRFGALAEGIVLAAGLSLQDPRERPRELEAAADAKHARYADPRSDLLALRKLYGAYVEQRRLLGRSALKRWCAGEFLSAARMREWEELVGQLGDICAELGWTANQAPAEYEAVHRALLAGFIGQIGCKDPEARGPAQYLGARGLRFQIAPGTPLRERAPRFVVCASLVETTRVYARMAAAVEPEWIESAAHHLLKREYGEPHWDETRGIVSARESVSLYGIALAGDRRVNYGAVAPEAARGIFVREAIVHGRGRIAGAFRARNAALKATLEAEEAALRRHLTLRDESEEVAFYGARLPPRVHSVAAMNEFLKSSPGGDASLAMTEADLRRPDAPVLDRALYPLTLPLAGNPLPVSYRFDPEAPDDGATVRVPAALLPKLAAEELCFGVPAWRAEKLAAIIRALPKALRRLLVPAPDVAARLVSELEPGTAFYAPLATALTRIAGTPIEAAVLRSIALPGYLELNLRVVDAAGRVLAEGRRLPALREGVRAAGPVASAEGPWQRSGVKNFDFGILPEAVVVEREGVRLELYPALVDEGTSAGLALLAERATAERATRAGVIRLLCLRLATLLRSHERELAIDHPLVLRLSALGSPQTLIRALVTRAVARACLPEGTPVPRDDGAFTAALESGRPEVYATLTRLRATLGELLLRREEAARAIEGLTGVVELRAELAQELGRLVPADFISTTPDPWFDALPRLLRSLERRATKLRAAPGAPAQQELSAAWQRFAALARRAASNEEWPVALAELRWLIEEYRVSLFAQELKTSVPVSAKRLAAAFAAAEAALAR
jgi:ATP-dependent helicase HrpA